MGRDLSLAPCGLVVERVETEAAGLLIVARPALPTAACPTCGSASARVHSTYQRFLADLPAHGRAVRISVRTRRFRCALTTCDQRIFTERLAATAARPFARRTMRLEGIVHHLGVALGGRPGQGFARRLLLPVSKDTLLRVVRRHAALPVEVRAWLASMTGRSSAVIIMERSSAIWSNGASSISCPIARQQLLPPGLPHGPRSPSSRGIVVQDIYKLPPRAARKRSRLPTAGT